MANPLVAYGYDSDEAEDEKNHEYDVANGLEPVQAPLVRGYGLSIDETDQNSEQLPLPGPTMLQYPYSSPSPAYTNDARGSAYKSPRPMTVDEASRSGYSSPMGDPLMDALQEEEGDTGPPTPFFDQLPPEPHGECSQKAQETVALLVAKDGKAFTSMLKGQKDFGNPELLDKVIGAFNIDPYGSNYPAEIYDPKAYEEEDYVDRLKQAEASKTQHLAIPVNMAPLQPPIPQRPGVLGGATGPAGEAARRPSKWGAPSAKQIASMVSAVHGRLQTLHGDVGSTLPGPPPPPQPPRPPPPQPPLANAQAQAQAQAVARKREMEAPGGGLAGLPPLPTKKSRFSQA